MGYYLFNRPRRDGRLSWPWLTDSGRFTHKVVTRPFSAQNTESSPARTDVLTTKLHHLCKVNYHPPNRRMSPILVPICLYCLICAKFGRLIRGKISKVVATQCHTLKQNATNLISVGAWPQAPLGELTVIPDFLHIYKGS